MILRLRWQGDVREVEVGANETLADAAARAGWPLNTLCNGRGRCGRCQVRLAAGRFRGPDGPLKVAGGSPLAVMACQTFAAADGVVDIPARSLREQSGRIADDFAVADWEWWPPVDAFPLGEASEMSDGAPRSDAERMAAAAERAGWHSAPDAGLSALADLVNLPADGEVIGWARGGRARAIAAESRAATVRLGLAIDIGTTTVNVLLADLREGRVVGQASDYNAQLARGADVAARITAADTPEGLAELRRLLLEDTLNPLIRRASAAAGCPPSRIFHVAVAGNTVMEHIFLGLPPRGLGQLPFRPVARRYPPVPAAELGLAAHPSAVVETIPALTAHVGGDLTADAIAARLLDRAGRVLLVDIGTNGEILLRDGCRLRCAATAAGPAFEGQGLSNGMRAADGAIEHIRWTGAGFDCETIGGGAARGICGSGVIDAMAELLDAGLMDTAGRFDMARMRAAGVAAATRRHGHEIHACRLAPAAGAVGEEILLSEADVAEILKAKAALHAGIVTLLRDAGLGTSDVDALVLAGGFARHIHLRNAVRIGLLPDLPMDRVEVIGNGALAGAYRALGRRDMDAEWERLLAIAEPVHLNLCAGFETEYVDSLFLPHADPSRFFKAPARV